MVKYGLYNKVKTIHMYHTYILCSYTKNIYIYNWQITIVLPIIIDV